MESLSELGHKLIGFKSMNNQNFNSQTLILGSRFIVYDFVYQKLFEAVRVFAFVRSVLLHHESILKIFKFKKCEENVEMRN